MSTYVVKLKDAPAVNTKDASFVVEADSMFCAAEKIRENSNVDDYKYNRLVVYKTETQMVTD